MEEKKEKSRASKIIDGEIEPEPNERYLLNLRKRKPFNQWDKEEHRKVAVMGGKAVQELHGEKKTAKQSLENILTLKVTDDILDLADIDPKIADKLKRDNPNATLYDLIQAVAVGKALDGNMKAYELVRDTHGDKPQDKLQIDGANVMTDSDRDMLKKIAERMEQADDILIVKDIKDNNN